MPHELNIINGDGGWKNEVIPTGKTVYLFPSLQIHNFECNDDFEYITGLIPKFENLAISSGYMAFPKKLIEGLSKVNKLELLTASPYVINI